MLPEAVWQRCYVHFLRNALDYVPRKVDDDGLMELRWFYDRRDLAEVRHDLTAWLAKWQAKYPKSIRSRFMLKPTRTPSIELLSYRDGYIATTGTDRMVAIRP